jgi:hypothetical protein
MMALAPPEKNGQSGTCWQRPPPIVATAIGVTDQTGALYQLLISTANQRGIFFAIPVNGRDLSSDINFSALIGASRSLSKRDFRFGMEITKVL